MINLRKFQTQEAFEYYYNGEDYKEPFVGIVEGTTGVNYNKKLHDYSQDYLTFNIISAGTIVYKAQDTAYTTAIEYSTDNGENWTSITSTTGGESIPVSAGDVIQFRGDNAAYSSGASRYNTFSSSTAEFEVEGNIMSLIDSTGYTTATTLASSYTFCSLFRDCTGLTSAENLVLPATTLAQSCYQSMFYGCTSLTTAPALPATTLAQSCYSGMFWNCTSLTTAPALPATTLANYCYSNMFAYCTSLTTAPEILPSTTLTNSCYGGMFGGCTTLTTAPALPATTLANNCYETMFFGCTSLITAPVLPATTLTENCYRQMFNGCTSLTTVPSLPATTLANWCYDRMFSGCTSLITAPELPAITLANQCYNQMFQNCTSLNYIKCLATNVSAYSHTYNWVAGVATSGTFVKNPNMSSWTSGANGIPNGWTIQDATS